MTQVDVYEVARLNGASMHRQAVLELLVGMAEVAVGDAAEALWAAVERVRSLPFPETTYARSAG